MENIEKRLKKVLIEFGIDQNKITKYTDYYFDLNLHIFDLMGLERKIKNEFMISIPENEILRMERISDTICFLEKQLVLKRVKTNGLF